MSARLVSEAPVDQWYRLGRTNSFVTWLDAEIHSERGKSNRSSIRTSTLTFAVRFDFRKLLKTKSEFGSSFFWESVPELVIHDGRPQTKHSQTDESGTSVITFPMTMIGNHAAILNPEGHPLEHEHVRNLQGLRPGGFGILIARNMVDEMIYNGRHNEVVLIKYLDPVCKSTN